MWKNVTGHTSYELVYGKKILLHIELEIKNFKISSELGLSMSESQQQKVLKLNEMDEVHQDTFQNTTLFQEQWARWNDKFIRKNTFKLGDWALLFDSR